MEFDINDRIRKYCTEVPAGGRLKRTKLRWVRTDFSNQTFYFFVKTAAKLS